MTKRTYLIGSEIVLPAPLPAPPAEAPVIRLVMQRGRPASGARPDYAAMRDAKNKLVGSSRQVAARAAKAEAQARVDREEAALRAQVQTAFRPPPGRLFSVDLAGLMLIGPGGGIGVTPVWRAPWRSCRLRADTCRNPSWRPAGAMWTTFATACPPSPASSRRSASSLTDARQGFALRRRSPPDASGL